MMTTKNAGPLPIMVPSDVLKTMSISEIAELVFCDWKATSKKGVNYAAKPYLDAMLDLEKISDKYALDSGKSIVLYFLSNATSYRGEQAKLVKAELNRRIKETPGF